MITTYLRSVMTNEDIPFPSASNAPAQTTDTAEITNPRLMMRSAFAPSAMVWLLFVNIPINPCGRHRHNNIPMHMIPAISSRQILKIFRTRSFSPAP